MIKHALFVRLEAKPGKETEVAQFLQAGLALAQQESTRLTSTGRSPRHWGRTRPSFSHRRRRSNASTCSAPSYPAEVRPKAAMQPE